MTDIDEPQPLPQPAPPPPEYHATRVPTFAENEVPWRVANPGAQWREGCDDYAISDDGLWMLHKTEEIAAANEARISTNMGYPDPQRETKRWDTPKQIDPAHSGQSSDSFII